MVTTPRRRPLVSCLCPTFHRPELLANAVACFLAQEYPGPAELIILDDGNDFRPAWSMHHSAGGSPREITIASTADRYPSLPEKFNAIANEASGEVLVVWEDDDIYLPHHLTAHVNALTATGMGYSKPSKVLSTYPGYPVTEDAAGRFHASIAFTREHFDRVGGWILTKRADFDQQFMSALARGVETADPIQYARPSYCFRYGSTNAYHGQHFMTSPDDCDWYDRVPRRAGNGEGELFPRFDSETNSLYNRDILEPSRSR